MEAVIQLFNRYAAEVEEQKPWGLHMRLWPNNSGAIICYDHSYREEIVLTEWTSTEEAEAAVLMLMNDLQPAKRGPVTTKFANWKPQMRVPEPIRMPDFIAEQANVDYAEIERAILEGRVNFANDARNVKIRYGGNNG